MNLISDSCDKDYHKFKALKAGRIIMSKETRERMRMVLVLIKKRHYRWIFQLIDNTHVTPDT